MFKKFFYLHPFFAALIPAIFLWSNDFLGLLPQGLFSTLAVLITFAGLIFFIFWLFWRDLGKAAITSSLFLLLTLSHEYIYSYTIGKFILSKPVFNVTGFVLSLIIFFAAIYVVKRADKDLFDANKMIFSIACFFLLISFIKIGVYYQSSESQSIRNGTESIIQTLIPSNKLRDVYYIILDEHASPEVLRDVMEYKKIDEFVSSLEKKGFFVAKQSTSNYHDTDFSLPSSLNMRYLTKEEIESAVQLRRLTEDHYLKDFFRDKGYNYFNFGTIWRDQENRYADGNITAGNLSFYQLSLWERTVFYPIGTFIVRNYLGDNALELLNSKFISKLISFDKRVRYTKDTIFKLEELAKVPERKGPNFVFAHFFIPHEPYVFDGECRFVAYKEMVKRSQTENYLQAVACIDKKIEALMNTLLEKSDPDPIIIIQGDHGARFLKPDELDYKNLNAYYFPDGGDSLLYDSITPVNSFRIMFNYYFGQNF